MDAVGDPTDLERSRDLGRAAVLAMLALAADNTGAVLDSTWYPYTATMLRAPPSPVVEVRCNCPTEVAQRRYHARMPTRRAGDLSARRPAFELWDDVHRTALGVGPLVRVDTNGPVEIPAVVHRIPDQARQPATIDPPSGQA